MVSAQIRGVLVRAKEQLAHRCATRLPGKGQRFSQPSRRQAGANRCSDGVQHLRQTGQHLRIAELLAKGQKHVLLPDRSILVAAAAPARPHELDRCRAVQVVGPDIHEEGDGRIRDRLPYDHIDPTHRIDQPFEAWDIHGRVVVDVHTQQVADLADQGGHGSIRIQRRVVLSSRQDGIELALVDPAPVLRELGHVARDADHLQGSRATIEAGQDDGVREPVARPPGRQIIRPDEQYVREAIVDRRRDDGRDRRPGDGIGWDRLRGLPWSEGPRCTTGSRVGIWRCRLRRELRGLSRSLEDGRARLVEGPCPSGRDGMHHEHDSDQGRQYAQARYSSAALRSAAKVPFPSSGQPPGMDHRRHAQQRERDDPGQDRKRDGRVEQPARQRFQAARRKRQQRPDDQQWRDGVQHRPRSPAHVPLTQARPDEGKHSRHGG